MSEEEKNDKIDEQKEELIKKMKEKYGDAFDEKAFREIKINLGTKDVFFITLIISLLLVLIVRSCQL